MESITTEQVNLTEQHQYGPLSKLVELFSSPKKTPKKTPKRHLKHIGRSRSTSETAEDELTKKHCFQPGGINQPYEAVKSDFAEAVTIEQLKPYLYQLVSKVSDLEREVVFLHKELESVKKQRGFPFKSLSGFLSKGSSVNSSAVSSRAPSTETSPTLQHREPAAFSFSRRRKASTIEPVETQCICKLYEGARSSSIDRTSVYLGTNRRRSSSEIISPRVTVIDEEPLRRKSSTDILKTPLASTRKKRFFSGRKPSDAPSFEGGEYSGVRRRSSSTSIIEIKRSPCDCASYGEMQTWAESFDALMNADRGRRMFREFLRSEYSEENLLFWLACEDLHGESNLFVVEEKTREIYQNYISSASPQEISLDSRTKEAVHQNMKIPSCTAFDAAQEHIYNLMRSDSFPRFVNSSFFRAELKKANQNY